MIEKMVINKDIKIKSIISFLNDDIMFINKEKEDTL